MSITKYFCSVFICKSTDDEGLPYDKPVLPVYDADDMSGMTDAQKKKIPIVRLDDMTEYSIKILNHVPRRARARVFVDGNCIAHVKIDPLSSVTIRRPVHFDRLLTFAKSSDVSPPDGMLVNPYLGHITVIADLEIRRPARPHEPCDDEDVYQCIDVVRPIAPIPTLSIGERSYGHGGSTIFGRPCGTQEFVKIETFKYSLYADVTINVLLVPKN